MSEAIIIFTRVPLEGKTKTRLQGYLTPKECRDIHRCFLKDIYTTCKSTNKNIFIFYTPLGYKDILKNLISWSEEYYLQEGEDLGEKMLNAIKYVLNKGYNSCVLIGTDVPQIKRDNLLDAFNVLKKKDIVIGSTYDKGYYLIGMKKAHKEIFQNQTYGTGDVFSSAVNRFKELGLTWDNVECLLDIDEKDDLLLLSEKINNNEVTNCLNTIDFIKKLKERRE